MRILVTGADGFIGQHILSALRRAGHSVAAGIRHRRGGARADPAAVACDFAVDVRPGIWRPRLRGFDAVVNCAGILRETHHGDFDRVHSLAPLALAQAAQELGIGRLVQISALGDPADGEFIASKHRGDGAMLRLDLPVTVLRPSLVVSLTGSHGGTSLLRALAALPLVLPLPGDGGQRLQPILAEDLARHVVAALERGEPARGIFEIGGPEVVTLRAYLEVLRAWLGMRRASVLTVPPALVGFAAGVGERFGRGPLGQTTWRLLQHGLVLSNVEALRRQGETFGGAPRSLGEAIGQTPCQTQDRWHARLYPLAPVLRLALAAVCLVSAFAGFTMTPAAMQNIAAPLGLSDETASMLGYGGAAVDTVLGAMLLVPTTAVAAARLLFVLALGYTIALGVWVPGLWLDPLGGLIKNLVLLPAIAAYVVLARK